MGQKATKEATVSAAEAAKHLSPSNEAALRKFVQQYKPVFPDKTRMLVGGAQVEASLEIVSKLASLTPVLTIPSYHSCCHTEITVTPEKQPVV